MPGGVPGRLLDQTQGPCANLGSAAGNPVLGFVCRRVRRIGTPYPFKGEQMIALDGRDWLVICPECAVHAGIVQTSQHQPPVHVEAWVTSEHVGAAAYRIPAREQAAIAAARAVPVAPHVEATRTSLGVLRRLAAVWVVTWVRVRLDAASQRVAGSIRRQLDLTPDPASVEVTVLDAHPLELTATVAPDRSWMTATAPTHDHVRTLR